MCRGRARGTCWVDLSLEPPLQSEPGARRLGRGGGLLRGSGAWRGALELLREVFVTPPADPVVSFRWLCQPSPLLTTVCVIIATSQMGKLETQKGQGLSEDLPPGPPAPSPGSRPRLPCLS